MRTKRNPNGAMEMSRARWTLLLYNDFTAACKACDEDHTDPWEPFIWPAQDGDAWRLIEVAALQEWTERYPGTRPMVWWYHSAAELRQVWGRFRPSRGAGGARTRASRMANRRMETTCRWSRAKPRISIAWDCGFQANVNVCLIVTSNRNRFPGT